MPEPVLETVEAVVLKATGRRPLDFQSLRRDEDYWIVAVETASGEPLIVKLASSTSVPSFEVAKAKHDLIRHTAQVPMAEMIAADDSASEMPYRYSVQTRLSGEEWFTRRERLDDADRDRALANLGDVVGRLHRSRMPRFGALPEPRFRGCFPALVAHARRIIRNNELDVRFSDVLQANADLWAGVIQPTITHDDLHGFNVLFRSDLPTEVSGILDFDKAWSGPAESDLARMELWRGMSGPSFLAAYRERIPELPGYEERRPFYQLLWCLEFAQNTPDHLETTNGLFARMGLPRLESFS